MTRPADPSLHLDAEGETVDITAKAGKATRFVVETRVSCANGDEAAKLALRLAMMGLPVTIRMEMREE